MIDKNAQGTVVGENAVDKRSNEELVLHCSNPLDVSFMYKVVSNQNFMKFGVTLKKSFNVEQDEVKFAFNLVLK